jgi:hypothetical protein
MVVVSRRGKEIFHIAITVFLDLVTYRNICNTDADTPNADRQFHQAVVFGLYPSQY